MSVHQTVAVWIRFIGFRSG